MTLIIYAKNGLIKVIQDFEKDKKEQLLTEGYIATKRIEICEWLEWLHNNCNEAKQVSVINDLTKKIGNER
jgi:hypothetical protein